MEAKIKLGGKLGPTATGSYGAGSKQARQQGDEERERESGNVGRYQIVKSSM